VVKNRRVQDHGRPRCTYESRFSGRIAGLDVFYYGSFQALKHQPLPNRDKKGPARDRSFRLRKIDLLRCFKPHP